MTVHLKNNDELKISSVHYMPCKIHYDGEAKVNKYFTYDKENEGSEELTASFRGYPLIGKEIPLPDGYKGRIFEEKKKPFGENMPRHLKATHAFDSIVYWNWDKPPSKADPFISALEWINIAKAMHEDSDDEDA